MLEGKKVNLSIVERSDLPTLKQWVNDVNFVGEFEPFQQETLADLEKQYDSIGRGQWYFIEKKGTQNRIHRSFQVKGIHCNGLRAHTQRERKRVRHRSRLDHGRLLVPQQGRNSYTS
jgi:hypothetical protein